MQALTIHRTPRTALRPTARRGDARRGWPEAAAFERSLGVRSHAADSAGAEADGLPVLDVEWSALGADAARLGDAPHVLYARTCLLGRAERARVINYYA